MREVHCLHYFGFIFLMVWPYRLDSGPAMEINSKTILFLGGLFPIWHSVFHMYSNQIDV